MIVKINEQPLRAGLVHRIDDGRMMRGAIVSAASAGQAALVERDDDDVARNRASAQAADRRLDEHVTRFGKGRNSDHAAPQHPQSDRAPADDTLLDSERHPPISYHYR